MPTIGDTRAQYDAFLKAEYARWGQAVKISGEARLKDAPRVIDHKE